jgi:hypothetical protein
MIVPFGGNKWSHENTRRKLARQAAERRARKKALLLRSKTTVEKCECGRFKGDVVCQCRIEQVRREMVSDEQLKMCLQMGAETETREREDSE